MRTIYIEPNEFKCHTSQNEAGTLISMDTEVFDGKCDAYIEGYRFVPGGESWTRSDGIVFTGEMIAPWKSYKELDRAQRLYEQNQIAQYESALAEIEAALGV